jgi:hypothetical protein
MYKTSKKGYCIDERLSMSEQSTKPYRPQYIEANQEQFARKT